MTDVDTEHHALCMKRDLIALYLQCVSMPPVRGQGARLLLLAHTTRAYVFLIPCADLLLSAP